jgi:hypothetical protein
VEAVNLLDEAAAVRGHAGPLKGCTWLGRAAECDCAGEGDRQRGRDKKTTEYFAHSHLRPKGPIGWIVAYGF